MQTQNTKSTAKDNREQGDSVLQRERGWGEGGKEAQPRERLKTVEMCYRYQPRTGLWSLWTVICTKKN